MHAPNAMDRTVDYIRLIARRAYSIPKFRGNRDRVPSFSPKEMDVY